LINILRINCAPSWLYLKEYIYFFAFGVNTKMTAKILEKTFFRPTELALNVIYMTHPITGTIKHLHRCQRTNP